MAGANGQHVINLGLLGTTVLFGLRPPWEVRWLGLPFLPLILMFWGWVVGQIVRKPKPHGAWVFDRGDDHARGGVYPDAVRGGPIRAVFPAARCAVFLVWGLGNTPGYGNPV